MVFPLGELSCSFQVPGNKDVFQLKNTVWKAPNLQEFLAEQNDFIAMFYWLAKFVSFYNTTRIKSFLISYSQLRYRNVFLFKTKRSKQKQIVFKLLLYLKLQCFV